MGNNPQDNTSGDFGNLFINFQLPPSENKKKLIDEILNPTRTSSKPNIAEDKTIQKLIDFVAVASRLRLMAEKMYNGLARYSVEEKNTHLTSITKTRISSVQGRMVEFRLVDCIEELQTIVLPFWIAQLTGTPSRSSSANIATDPAVKALMASTVGGWQLCVLMNLVLTEFPSPYSWQEKKEYMGEYLAKHVQDQSGNIFPFSERETIEKLEQDVLPFVIKEFGQPEIATTAPPPENLELKNMPPQLAALYQKTIHNLIYSYYYAIWLEANKIPGALPWVQEEVKNFTPPAFQSACARFLRTAKWEHLVQLASGQAFRWEIIQIIENSDGGKRGPRAEECIHAICDAIEAKKPKLPSTLLRKSKRITNPDGEKRMNVFKRSDGTMLATPLGVSSVDRHGSNFSLKIDFPGVAERLAEESKKRFLKDGYHSITFVFFTAARELIQATPVVADDNELLQWLESFVRQNKVGGMIFIKEIWYYDGSNPHTVRQIKDGEMEVKDLDKKDRKEALQVLAANQRGYVKLWETPIICSEEKGTLGETQSTQDMGSIKNKIKSELLAVIQTIGSTP